MNKEVISFKRIVSMCIVALMIVTAIPQLALSTLAASGPDGYTTDEHGISPIGITVIIFMISRGS